MEDTVAGQQTEQVIAQQHGGVVTAYKGFNKDFVCHPKGGQRVQYAVGEALEIDGTIKACKRGFHACEYPLDMFGYYPPADSRFALVEMSGELSRENSDSKIAAARISIKAELKIPEIISRAVGYILARIESSKTESNTGDRSAATNTGYQSAATNTGYRSAATNTGYQSAATNTGDRSAATNTGDQSAATNTGDRSAATNTGDQSAATNTGDQSAATNTGYQSAATNTGYRSAATNTGYQSAATNTGYQSAATNTGYRSAATNTGDQSAATNTGYQSAATNTGYQSAATNTGYRSAATNTGYQSAASVEGKHAVAAATGIEGRAKASAGSAMVLCYRDQDGDGDDYGRILHIRAAIAGRDGVKPDTWYSLDAAGNFVEVE